MNNKEQLIKNLVILTIAIILCAILIRYVSKGENLYDYANKNGIPVHSETTEEKD